MRPERLGMLLAAGGCEEKGGDMATTKRNGGKQAGILARVGDFLAGDGGPKTDQDVKATTMLKEDHDRVRDLFKRYDDLGERAHAEKQRIVAELSRELEIHAQLEEKIFYPACLRGEKDTKKIVRESFEEHKIVKTLLGELDRLTPNDEQFDAKVTVLKESVEHHAKEEEDDLFPKAEDQLDDEGLQRLGAEMKSLKENLQKRASPASPRKGKRPIPTRARAKRSRSRSGSQQSYT
jgi:hemerythrin-like domain-containing protein